MLGDQPQAHYYRRREEGLQLSPAEGQPDRKRHRVHRSTPAGQEERMGHHGLSQVTIIFYHILVVDIGIQTALQFNDI